MNSLQNTPLYQYICTGAVLCIFFHNCVGLKYGIIPNFSYKLSVKNDVDVGNLQKSNIVQFFTFSYVSKYYLTSDCEFLRQ